MSAISDLLYKFNKDLSDLDHSNKHSIDIEMMKDNYGDFLVHYVKKMPILKYTISNELVGGYTNITKKIESIMNKQVENYEKIVHKLSINKKYFIVDMHTKKTYEIGNDIFGNKKSYIDYINKNLKINARDNMGVILLTQVIYDPDLDNMSNLYVNKLPHSDKKFNNIIFLMHVKAKEFRRSYMKLAYMLMKVHNQNLNEGGNMFIYTAHDSMHADYCSFMRLLNQHYQSQILLFKKIFLQVNIRGMVCFTGKKSNIIMTNEVPTTINIDIEQSYIDTLNAFTENIFHFTTKQTKYYAQLLDISLDPAQHEYYKFTINTLTLLYS